MATGVRLASSSNGAATVPPSVTVARDASSAAFAVSTAQLSAPTRCDYNRYVGPFIKICNDDDSQARA